MHTYHPWYIHVTYVMCVMKDEREKSGNTEKKVGMETAFTNAYMMTIPTCKNPCKWKSRMQVSLI